MTVKRLNPLEQKKLSTSVEPIIMNAINSQGLKLSRVEMAKVKESIEKGLSINVRDPSSLSSQVNVTVGGSISYSSKV